MSAVVNERDLIIRLGANRTVSVDPPGSVNIPGYTGIVLSTDIRTFGGNGQVPVYPARAILTASLRGIPSTQAITWTTTNGILLTDTPDPLIKLIEASKWPGSNGVPGSTVITVSVLYGGATHTDSEQIYVMHG